MKEAEPTAWTQLAPWLEELLPLSAAERATRLAELDIDNPRQALELRRVLAGLALLDDANFMGRMVTAVAPSQSLGQTVGAYTLDRLLGEGGMGAVWLAHRSDGHYQGQVAIKFLQAGRRNPAMARRFAREAQVLARLAHPHIATLLDAGLTPTDHQPYLVLEYVQGEPIDRWCERHSLGLRARLQLMLDVLDAVAHAHGRLVLHRDLKPSNILVNPQGQAKLLDFGIAQLLGDAAAGDVDLTLLGGTVYTPRWASPEQLEGGELTPASDVFALGLLLHLLLTGLHPVAEPPSASGGAPRARPEPLRQPLPLASAALRAQRPAADRARIRALQGDLDTVIAKALKPAAAERYRNAAELADDLRLHPAAPARAGTA